MEEVVVKLIEVFSPKIFLDTLISPAELYPRRRLWNGEWLI
jgi:hypothetical protein